MEAHDRYMARLTLSIDIRVASRAKEYAKRRGLSISRMVEAYLASVVEPELRAHSHAPILSSLRGVLQKRRMRDYRKHLAAKYR